ncbi:MAG: hypothetical protein R3200_15050 [Xanthomonadales bacterium]|nr:hypothetical protein [Xanthomonadales bacterium]
MNMAERFLTVWMALALCIGGVALGDQAKAAKFRSTVYSEGAADFFALVGITNVSTSDQAITIEFIDDEGNLLGGMQNVIAPQETWRITTSDLGIDTRGRMILTNSGSADDILFSSASVTTMSFAALKQDWKEVPPLIFKDGFEGDSQ